MVIIGGIIVASVLAFIIFLIVRYRVCNQGDTDKVSLACFALFLFFCLFIISVDNETAVCNLIAFILFSLPILVSCHVRL